MCRRFSGSPRSPCCSALPSSHVPSRAYTPSPSPPPQGETVFTPCIVSRERGTLQPAPRPTSHRVPVQRPAARRRIPPSPPQHAHSETAPACAEPIHLPGFAPFRHVLPTPLLPRCTATAHEVFELIPGAPWSGYESPRRLRRRPAADLRDRFRLPPGIHGCVDSSSCKPHPATGPA